VQSRTMSKVLLGLYGRRGGEVEIIGLYVQMSAEPERVFWGSGVPYHGSK
jgi:hypothetical protein